MNNNDISMNIIYNELLKMYNNHFNKSTIVEPFTLPSVNNNMKNFFIEIVIRAKNYGYEINFTIDEFNNVFSYLELRAKLLTFEQQEKRKKVFINIKDILLKFKELGQLDIIINEIITKTNQAINQTLEQKQNFNIIESIRPNVFALHTLLLNVVDLFIEDIEDISNNIISLTIKENLEKENIKLNKINKESEDKINQSEDKIKQSEDKIKQSEDKIKQSENKIKELEEKIKYLDQNNITIKKDNEELENKIKQLNNNINNNNYIIITLIILLFIVIVFYFLKK
jgi:chromosome segregation ATPase